MKHKKINALNARDALLLFREYRAKQTPLVRGKVEQQTLRKLDSDALFTITVLVSILVFSILFGFIIAPAMHDNYANAYLLQLMGKLHISTTGFSGFFDRLLESIAYGVQFTLILFWLVLLLPFFVMLIKFVLKRKLPTTEYFDSKNMVMRFIQLLALGFGITTLFIDNTFFVRLLPIAHYNPDKPGVDFFILSIVIATITFFLLRFLPKTDSDRSTPVLDRFAGTRISRQPESDFSLYVGDSTGTLLDRKHVAGLKKNQRVFLSEKDAALNVLILGGIGEGKTSNAINGLLLQLLDQDCGGLIFDVKGSFHKTVNAFSKLTGKKVITVGACHQKINLIAGLKPEIAADLITSIFYMTNGSQKDSFWITQSANLCRGAFGLLSFLPLHYSLEGLRKYIFDTTFREEIDIEISKLDLPNEKTALLLSYKQSLGMFYDCHERMQSDIKAAASSALSQFTHPSIVESFCYTQNPTPLQLEDVLNGTIFLVDMPKSEYGQLSRVIHALIKMRWFHVMESRRRHEEWDQNRMVFFMCDEYQSLVTANGSEGTVSDLSFWDKARDTKTIGIITAQSISSFYSAIGDRDLANTVLQNFRQRLSFKTEDEVTLEHLRKIAGDVDVIQKTQSINEGNSRSMDHSQKTYSSSESLTHSRQSVIDGQLMRTLEPNQAIALLNIDQRSMDDVLNLQPIYLN